jgi:hypothetical protein
MKRGVWLRVALILGFAAVLIALLFVVGSHYRNRRPSVTGAVLQQNDDTRKQSPIADVEVTVANDQEVAPVKTNASGFFKLELRPTIRPHEELTLQFRHPNYQPLDLKTTTGNKLYVIHMAPLHSGEESSPNRPDVVVANVLVRYSIETHAEVNIGTGVKTFQVPNAGDVPCDSRGPCSPDGRWKAAIATASLDAGQGNVFRNARIFCIAGPCPFTKIESDEFSEGGRYISVAVRNWSDTTTFLFEAEVFREQVSNIVRQSYPVIFGRTLNFSLPAAAEGPSLEAELNRTQITFPLPPDPKLSWAACSVIFGSHLSKSYRCELRPGFKFQ